MKRIFTPFFLFISLSIFAGTPTINGVYSPTEGWGTEVASGDNIAGWNGANAYKLYVTFDANYYYFGATCNAQNWHQFIFAVNTKVGGDSTDSWGRQIKYKHTNAPDYLFRGDIAGGNYAEFHSWSGTAWTGTGVNANLSGTEVKGTFNGSNDGFIEIRVPKSVISGNPLTGDIQFIIGGNANDHGCFDAIPSEPGQNSTGWTPPQSSSRLSLYVSSVPLPTTLNYFRGNVKNNNVVLEWQTTKEINLNNFDVEKQQGNSWQKLSSVFALNTENGSSYSYIDVLTNGTNLYRLKMNSINGEAKYSNVISITSNTKTGTQIFPTLIHQPSINIRTIENEAGKLVVKISDVSGRLVQQSNYSLSAGDITQTFILTPLKQGLYFVAVETNSGTKIFEIFVQ